MALAALLALAGACSSSNSEVKPDGAAGTTDTGGTGPCSGICMNPINVAPNSSSGDLGTGATCHEVAGEAGSVACGNFVASRTFTVNGVTIECAVGGGGVLPDARNGGWCIQAGPGDYSYSYFATYNVR